MREEIDKALALRAEAANALGARFVHYADMADFRERFEGRSQVGAVHGEALPLDFKMNPRAGSDTLSVFFNSQQYGSDIKLFTWQRVSEQLDTHRLYISDSAVYSSPSVRLGWYSYAAGVHVLDRVQQLIEGVAARLGVTRFVFFGSSGGAFPAALLMERFRPSVGILVCPSLTIPQHQNPTAVNNWLTHCAQTGSFEEFRHLHPDVTLEAWDEERSEEGVSRVVVHNVQDHRFEERDLRPYLRSLGMEYQEGDSHGGPVSVLTGDWGAGHTTPPADEVQRLVLEVNAQLHRSGALDLSTFRF